MPTSVNQIEWQQYPGDNAPCNALILDGFFMVTFHHHRDNVISLPNVVILNWILEVFGCNEQEHPRTAMTWLPKDSQNEREGCSKLH